MTVGQLVGVPSYGGFVAGQLDSWGQNLDSWGQNLDSWGQHEYLEQFMEFQLIQFR